MGILSWGISNLYIGTYGHEMQPPKQKGSMITGEAIDLANFRRKMLSSGQLEDTGEKLRVGRNRPAAVYRYVQSALRQFSSWDYSVNQSNHGSHATGNDVLAALTTV